MRDLFSLVLDQSIGNHGRQAFFRAQAGIVILAGQIMANPLRQPLQDGENEVTLFTVHSLSMLDPSRLHNRSATNGAMICG
ncbi:hypothetical protein [Novosphingobium rosa]|uniref:hypothetical protein n=1 Tax=Novosphingobium rosa TaxID=76978 RepID=UPI0012EE9979|nr:hypothetical protein [Novosphingobium rosa]